MKRASTIFIHAIGTVLLLAFSGVVTCSAKKSEEKSETINAAIWHKPRILRMLPHDSTAFTQGLVFDGTRLIESAGLYRQSRLRTIDTNGMLIAERPLPDNIFAEGCAIFSGKLYLLTWREGLCLVFSIPELAGADTLAYQGEGWGLTADRERIIMSNGSDTLFFRDRNFNLISKKAITYEGRALSRLNELEYAKGYVLANVWYSDYIFAIDPQTGMVRTVIDCTELVKREAPVSSDRVLNGIAFHPEHGTFYCTGKHWKYMFEVELPLE